MADALTEEEIEQFREGFALFDLNGDGKIKVQQLGVVMRSIGQTPSDEQLQEIIVECDEHRTGEIEFDKFINMMGQKIKEANNEDEIREAFRVFDKDGNGFISAAELRHVMTNLGEKLTDEEMDDLMKETDVDSSGTVDYEDLVKVLTGQKD